MGEFHEPGPSQPEQAPRMLTSAELATAVISSPGSVGWVRLHGEDQTFDGEVGKVTNHSEYVKGPAVVIHPVDEEGRPVQSTIRAIMPLGNYKYRSKAELGRQQSPTDQTFAQGAVEPIEQPYLFEVVELPAS